MKRNLFQVLAEMHQDDVTNDSRFVAVSPHFIEGNKCKQGATVKMGIDEAGLFRIMEDKVMPLLLLVDREEFKRREHVPANNATGSTHVLGDTVFPSEEKTVMVAHDEDYGGAHRYTFINSVGFKDGKAVYDYITLPQTIQFVQKNADGTMTPGVQSEQLVIALMDRTRKLNAKFPSEQNAKMIEGLQIFLDACRERIEDRIQRGVMGDLKK